MLDEQQFTKTILLVEDDVDIGPMLLQVFEYETNYNVILATDGKQALSIVDEIKPDLFIFNYQLPGISGIELYDRLQSIPELQHIPALLISANLPQDELKRRRLMSLHKPFELDDLLQKIETLLQ